MKTTHTFCLLIFIFAFLVFQFAFEIVGAPLVGALAWAGTQRSSAAKPARPAPTSEKNPELKGKEEPPIRAVVTATRREIAYEKATRFVTVLTREDIEKSGAVYVTDLLRAVPGLTVTQSGPAGRTVSVFTRGTNSTHTLVLVDGVEINTLTTGTPNLENFTTENVERIEILRGPQSVLYGSKAMGGVIQIITKSKGEKGMHGSGNFEYGTHRTFNEGGEISGQWKKFSFTGTAARLDTHGPSENDGFQDTRVSGHGKVQVTDNSNLEAGFQYYNGLAGIEDGPFATDPNNWQRSREQIASTTYEISLADSWQQSVQYSFFHDMLLNIDPPNEGAGEAESKFKLDADRHHLDYQSVFFIRDFDVFTAGYEFEYGQANNKSFDRLIRNHGWFLQNELTLWKIWEIVEGVRFDRHELFGETVSPLVSSSLWIEKTLTRLKASFGKGFRAPTLNELFFPGFGNPLLQPEQNWGWDAGFEQSYWDKKGNFSVDYFHNSLKNLIEFDANFIPQNVARAKTQGIEMENQIKLYENLTFSTSYTYTNAVDEATGKRLTRRPWHQGKLSLTYDWWKFHLRGDWILVGTREDQTGVFGRPPREKNAGYTRLDALVSFDLNTWSQVYFRGENLTDDHYDEALGFDNPTARFFVGTKAKF